MSNLKINHEMIRTLESQQTTLKQKIYKELMRIIDKDTLNEWHKEHKAKLGIRRVADNTDRPYIGFSLYVKHECFYFDISKYYFEITFIQRCIDGDYYEVDLKRAVITQKKRRMLALEDTKYLIVTLLNCLRNIRNDIFNTYEDLYNYPILENRQAAITVLCIYYYRQSTLSVFPKDMINLICKAILKYRIS